MDHVLVFSILDNKVWFRNYQVSRPPLPPRISELPSCLTTYRHSPSGEIIFTNETLLPLTTLYLTQIIEKDPLQPSGPPQTSLVEIGPRFVLTPIRIFEGSFGGPTVFENSEFVSPSAVRSSMRREAGDKYRSRKQDEGERRERGKRRREDVGEDQLGRKKVFG